MACFQGVGNEPWLNDELMMDTKGGTRMLAADFRTFGGMLSDPADL